MLHNSSTSFASLIGETDLKLAFPQGLPMVYELLEELRTQQEGPPFALSIPADTRTMDESPSVLKKRKLDRMPSHQSKSSFRLLRLLVFQN